MRRLTSLDYLIEAKAHDKFIENALISLRKQPGKDVAYNYVHMDLEWLNKNGYIERNGVTIKKHDEPVIVEEIIDEDYANECKDYISLDKNEDGTYTLTEELCISSYEIISSYELDNVMTTTEAALLWGMNESTVRKAIQTHKFMIGRDYRKAGRVTLITKKAMERVYGKRQGLSD